MSNQTGWQVFGPKDDDGKNDFDKLSDEDKDSLRRALRLSEEAKRFSLSYEVARMRERSVIVLASIPAVVWTAMLTFFFAVDEQLCIRLKRFVVKDCLHYLIYCYRLRYVTKPCHQMAV